MNNEMPDKKRLAKNTLLLYLRTLIVMFISLYTSRIILDTLGISDYGIYNIVGGFVGLFSVISGTLVASTQRFLSFELGKGEKEHSQKVFCTSLTIHFFLAIVILFLFETIGLWFLNNELNLPTERLTAANACYQCSVFTFLVGLMNSPYVATIIAHEKMGAFAYLSLIDVFAKLAIVYTLYMVLIDKLIVYSVFLFCVALLVNFLYWIYCRRNFKETKFKIIREKDGYVEILKFAGLNFVGSFASILSQQGINVLLNIFFGVTINAARGIASQVENAVMKFVYDFSTALNPQITKTYASGDKSMSINLAYYGSRIAFFLTLIFTVPVFFKTTTILDLWLKHYPLITVSFIRLSFIYSLLSVLSNPIITVMLASGNIKKMTYYIGSFRLLILPICWLLLHYGYMPETVYFVIIAMEFLSLVIRMVILQDIMSMSILKGYIKNVISKIVPVAFIIFCSCEFLQMYLPNTIIWLIPYIILSEICCMLTVLFVGLNAQERKKMVGYVKQTIKKIRS